MPDWGVAIKVTEVNASTASVDKFTGALERAEQQSEQLARTLGRSLNTGIKSVDGMVTAVERLQRELLVVPGLIEDINRRNAARSASLFDPQAKADVDAFMSTFGMVSEEIAQATTRMQTFVGVLESARTQASALNATISGGFERSQNSVAAFNTQLEMAIRETQQLGNLTDDITARNAARNATRGVGSLQGQRDADRFMQSFEGHSIDAAKATDLIAINVDKIGKNTQRAAGFFSGQLDDAITKFKSKVTGIGTDIGKMAFGFAASGLVTAVFEKIFTPPSDAELARLAAYSDEMEVLGVNVSKVAQAEIDRRTAAAEAAAIAERQEGFRGEVGGLVPDLFAQERAIVQLEKLRSMFAEGEISARQFYRATDQISLALAQADLSPLEQQIGSLSIATMKWSQDTLELNRLRDADRISMDQYTDAIKATERAFDAAMLAQRGFAGEMALAVLGPQQRYEDLLENEDDAIAQLTLRGYSFEAAQRAVNAQIETAARALPGVTDALAKQEQAAARAAAATAQLRQQFKALEMEGLDPATIAARETAETHRLIERAMKDETIGVERATQAWIQYQARQEQAEAERLNAIEESWAEEIKVWQARQQFVRDRDLEAQRTSATLPDQLGINLPTEADVIEIQKRRREQAQADAKRALEETQQIGMVFLDTIHQSAVSYLETAELSFKSLAETLGNLLDQIFKQLAELALTRLIMGTGIDAATGGHIGGLAGLLGLQHGYDGMASQLPHYAGGVDRMIGGTPGTDRNLVAFWAGNDERLRVTTPLQDAREEARRRRAAPAAAPLSVTILPSLDPRSLVETAHYSAAGVDAAFEVISRHPRRARRLLP